MRLRPLRLPQSPRSKRSRLAKARPCRAAATIATATPEPGSPAFLARRGEAFCLSSCRLLPLRRAGLGLPQPGCQAIREGAPDFLAWGIQAPLLIAEPDAGRFADRDRDRESGCRIQRAGRDAPDQGYELEHFTQAIPECPPRQRAAA